MEKLKRTHTCGELTAKNQGQQVSLMGWVDNWRDHGQLIFIDLRDRDGMPEVVFRGDNNPNVHKAAKGLRSEFVIAIHGTVGTRGEGLSNPKLKTGEIEVLVDELRV